MTNFDQLQLDIFRTAQARGLPLFPQEISKSNALNSAPYLIPMDEFERCFAKGLYRARLIQGFKETLSAAVATGAEPLGALIGGSILKCANPRPNDIDALCFYSASGSVAEDLAALQQKAKLRSVDIRFVPINADPLVALKACAFFTLLYSSTRAAQADICAPVLVRLGETSDK